LNKASQEEKNAANASTNLSNTISSNMNSTFANSQATQGALGARLNQITNAGMAGQGFLGGQEQNLRDASLENSAQGNVSAQQALNQRNAGGEQGGAATSGSVGANNAAVATGMAQQNARNQFGITNQNATLANANMQEGLNGLSSLSGQQTQQADGLSGTAVGANSNSFHDETQAYQPSTFWSGLGSSALSGVIGGVSGNPMGALNGVKGLFGGGGNGNGNGGGDPFSDNEDGMDG
jgi:hypothetical protein